MEKCKLSKRWEREEKIIDRLQIENKALKRRIKHLEKSIRKLNKGYDKLRVEDKVEEKDLPSEAKKCWECNSEYREIIIANRRFRKCQGCGKQGKVTIINEKNNT